MLKRKDQDAVRAAFRDAKDHGATGPELMMLSMELAYDASQPYSDAAMIVGKAKAELYEVYDINLHDILYPKE